MKSIYIGIFCLISLWSCKNNSTENNSEETTSKLTVAEKIAIAHGLEQWKNVSEIKFTFRVDTDTIKGKERHWTWHPKEDRVLLDTGKSVLQYVRSKMDSTQINTDRAFINDKYWLLVPFQLVWDTSATISKPKKSIAPISKTELQLITLSYPDVGGYTPGDAYDIYFDDTFLIREWVFRKDNSKTPSLITTFENYKTFNGIKIATDHKQEGGQWNLNFSDISVHF